MSTTTGGDTRLAARVWLIRAAADLIEQADITGLAIWPERDEIVIQVPAPAITVIFRVSDPRNPLHFAVFFTPNSYYCYSGSGR